MDGVLYQKEIENDDVLDSRLPPLIKGLKLKAGQGVIPKGCIMSLDADGLGVPYETYDAEDMAGTVDGTNKAFTYDGSDYDGELAPRSVVVSHGDQELKDDGHGHLYGDGSGTVNYITGEISATLDTAPASESGAPEVVASKQPVAVTLRTADTTVVDDKAKQDIIAAVFKGSVSRGQINVDGEDAEDIDAQRLETAGVYPLY